MPPAPVPLTSRTIVDLSHESLMRCWARLIAVGGGGARGGGVLCAPCQAAAWHEQGTAGLWRNPELELAQQWKAQDAADGGVGAPI